MDGRRPGWWELAVGVQNSCEWQIRRTGSGLAAVHSGDRQGGLNIEDGLIVPVLRDAGRLDVGGVASAVADLTARAKAGKLTLEDLEGATFTVSKPPPDASRRPVPLSGDSELLQ